MEQGVVWESPGYHFQGVLIHALPLTGSVLLSEAL